MKTNLKPVLEQIEKEMGISRDEVFEMLESALQSAFTKHAAHKDQEYHAKVDRKSGKIRVFAEKKVVKEVKDPKNEVDKVTAMQVDPSASIGDTVNIEVSADKFGRIAAQTAKQIIIQKIRENERENMYQQFKDKEGEVVTASVYRMVKNACIVEIGSAEAILPQREQIKSQDLQRGESIKVYIVEVKRSGRGPRILVSRTHPGLVEGLFNLEVPEVAEDVVEIIKIVRDPGVRCKVAVLSHNPRVDPIGACVGINGVRVQSVINELGGERMDLIKYSDNANEFLANSLSPATVKEVKIIDEEEKEARLVVDDEMLSLAIGKNGQNVRLAARLTNWHIDIQSETQMKQLEKKDFKKNFYNISSLPGVGEKTARMLIDSGYSNLKKLVEAGIESITSVKGIGKKKAENIIKAASENLEQKDENDKEEQNG
ncbi:MAG: transcription termination factor NusA [Elusimicrobiota bacterium]